MGLDLESVDPDGADTELARHPESPLDVRGEQPSAEAVFGVVGQPDGLLLGFEWHDGQHWAEDLLLRDGGRVVDVREDRRADEVAGREVAAEALTAGDQPGALGLAALDVAEPAPELFRVE